jgi:hypothetical protein
LLKISVPRGTAAMAVAIALWSHSCAPSEARAGLMLKADDAAVSLPTFPVAASTAEAADSDGIASSGSNGQDAGSDAVDELPIYDVAPLYFERAFHSTTGGASAPPGNSGSLAGISAASCVPGTLAEPPNCSTYRHWCEHAPRLPSPLSRELLDPPKSIG